jgi:hypothetical protein
MFCQECKKKPTCRRLCAGAEAYVDQDYVHQRERTYSGLSEPTPEGEPGNLPLDQIHSHLKFPYTFGELMGSPLPLCTVCKKPLVRVTGRYQVCHKECAQENKRRISKRASKKYRENEKLRQRIIWGKEC